MFSGFGSPSLKSVQRRLSKSISRAGEILTGVGPTPTKQFKNAIVDGDEDKAIDIYTANDGDKPLFHELHPSKPFPSKKEKSSTDTPLHLATRTGLMKLCVALLGKGGDPTVLNERLETCLHCVCSMATHPDVRTTIMEILLAWRGPSLSENAVEGDQEKLSLNRVDIDGDTAIHLAALNGLVGCVEKLIALGAIISIVNKNNRTCCELADESSHSALALALELALIFQPVDSSMAEFAASQRFPYDGHQGRLLLSGQSFVETEEQSDLENFIDEVLQEVTSVLRERDQKDLADTTHLTTLTTQRTSDYLARAEALLTVYGWDVAKLVREYRENPVQVLTSARLQPFLPTESIWGKEAATTSADINTKLPAERSSVDKKEKEEVNKEVNEEVAQKLNSVQKQSPPETAVAEVVVKGEGEVRGESSVAGGHAKTNDVTDTANTTTTTSGSSGDVDTADIDITFDLNEGDTEEESKMEGKSESGAVEECVSAPVSVSGAEKLIVDTTTTNTTTTTPPAANTTATTNSNTTTTTSAPPLDPKDAPPMDTEGCCFVCGETLLPPLPIESFLNNTVSTPGSHALQCGSGHSFCIDCWSGSLTVQVKDNGLGCLPCLGYKCGEVLDKRWASVLLHSTELQSQFLNRRAQLVVDCCAALKACPIEHCGVVIRVAGMYESTSENIKHGIPASALCSNGHLFCLECLQPAHSPATCAQLPSWHKLVSDEIQSVDMKGKNGDDSEVQGADLANALWVAANTKKCPRCQTPIEKDEGCNHMNCRKCRKEFCWICMQDWSLHSDNTGGYFQCNRFVANLKVGDLPEGGGGVSELWQEESGNAHAETLRLREKNKRMARFIHHFTRFKAHSDSVKLEGRMFSETARRIHEGLLASMEGGTLKWLQGYQVPHPLMLEQESPASSPRARAAAPAAPSPRSKSVDLLPVSGEKSSITAANNSNSTTTKNTTNTAHTTTSTTTTGTANKAKTNNNRVARHFTEATAFLKDGFEELLKCRCILQWSYPYAYFEFENDDYNDYSRSLQQQRRGRYLRDQRSAFDLLQSELEAIVETLSDVVARRRLRAGKDQISLVTRAARSKRIELESVIVTSAINQQVQKSRNSPNTSSRVTGTAAGAGSSNNRSGGSSSRSRPEAILRSRQAVTSTRSSRHRPHTNSGNVNGAGLFRSDSDESIDLATLIYELELATANAQQDADSVRTRAALAATVDELEAQRLLQDRSRQLEALQLRMRQAFGTDAAAEAAILSASGSNGTNGEEGANINADLPPPIPSTTASSARSSGRSSRTARTPHTPPPAPLSSTSTPNTRRLELRQARNSPGGHRVSYTIDPDFEMESESESSSSSSESEEEGEVENNREEGASEDQQGPNTETTDGKGSDQVEESGVLSTPVAPPRRKKRSSRTTPGSTSTATDNVTNNPATAQQRADAERAAALRELLRFGSAGGIHAGRGASSYNDPDAVVGRSPATSSSLSSSAARQQMRAARIAQRAEEEANLNRAILMSLQENQTADRRLASNNNTTGEGGAAEDGGGNGGSTEASEEDVAMLVSMGFTREQATQALLENRNNVELAANRLLGIDF